MIEKLFYYLEFPFVRVRIPNATTAINDAAAADAKGERVNEAGPSMPVEILGFSGKKNQIDFLTKVLADNPLCQGNQCTPMGIIRKAR